MNLFKRKAPLSQPKQTTRFIPAVAVNVLEEIRLRIVREWQRGISIQYLAKDYEFSTRQIEHIIWSAMKPKVSPDPFAPTVTPRPFLVERRRPGREGQQQTRRAA